MRISPCRHPARAPRRGLTIAEVLVALVIVAVGALTVAGASALALRTSARATDAHRALRQLDRRLALIAAGGCAGAANGSGETDAGRVRERWVVRAAVNGAALVESTVEWREGARVRSIVGRSAILC